MSKKKRFRRAISGKIQMFFQKKHYIGFKNFFHLKNLTDKLNASLPVYAILNKHYLIVTKKKIYYTNN